MILTKQTMQTVGIRSKARCKRSHCDVVIFPIVLEINLNLLNRMLIKNELYKLQEENICMYMREYTRGIGI